MTIKPAAPHHCRPALIPLMLAALFSPSVQAGPATAAWSFVDLGTLGGTQSSGYGINNAGQVTGWSNTATAAGNTRPFLYSNGTMTALGTLGGNSSQGYGINDAGQVTGWSDTAGSDTAGGRRAFVYSNGTMTDLGTLGGNSWGWAINNAGQVTGWSDTTGGTRAFLYSNGTMTDLGTLGGNSSQGYGINNAGQVTGSSANRAFLYSNGTMTDLGHLGGNTSSGSAINSAGQVTGYSTLANGANRAFLYSNGTMTDLGHLGGNTSFGSAINSAGQVTGSSTITGGANRAFLYGNGTMTDLNTVAGVSGSGWTLEYARDINNATQITGGGLLGGERRAYLLSLDTVVWDSGLSGTWDGGNGWSFGATPASRMNVAIDPVRSLTVTGPGSSASVRTLTVGGDATGNNGVATLSLSGGTISVLGSGGAFTTISARGVLTGDGTLTGVVTNLGTVSAQHLTLTGGLNNQGLVTGDGRLNTSLTNASSGLVQAGVGQTLRLSGAAHSNAGQIEVIGGGNLVVSGTFANNSGGQLYVTNATARFASAATNAAGGRIQSDDGVLRFNGGLTNNGQMQVTFGASSIFGNVTTDSGGKVILSGNSNTTFYDTVEVKSGGELRVSTGSTAVFFGQVLQRTGSTFSGSGTKFYEGGLTVGGSPGLGTDAGDVNFGSGNVYEAEIGGLAPGSEFDKYLVSGKLTFGGTLKLISWQGFTGLAGHSYDLFDWGTAAGAFDAIDADGLLLASGTRLDTSRLYLDGTISVAAVPEPGEWAMLLTGLVLVGGVARRRGRGAMARDEVGRTEP